MGANLFKNTGNSCLSEAAKEELNCLGVTIKETGCTIENTAPYSEDLESLLQSYPVFRLDLPLNQQGFLFNSQDRAIFIENDGYQVSLREAKLNITTYAMAADPLSWDLITRFKVDKKFELYSMHELRQNFSLFYDSRYMKRWGDMAQNWGDFQGTWANHGTKREYVYRGGDTFIKLSQCEETICLYIVIDDISEADYTRFSANDERWYQVTCISTGLNKCTEYARKKKPADLYKVVQIGSRGDYVEVPLRYEPAPPVFEPN